MGQTIRDLIPFFPPSILTIKTSQMGSISQPVVYLITGNANKLREVKEMLEPTISVHSRNLDIVEIQGSIEDITRAKCQKAAELVCRETRL